MEISTIFKKALYILLWEEFLCGGGRKKWMLDGVGAVFKLNDISAFLVL